MASHEAKKAFKSIWNIILNIGSPTVNPLSFSTYLYYNRLSYIKHYSKLCLRGEFYMAKKAKHNLNKMKGTKILLLILALSFVVAPLISMVAYVIARLNNTLF